MSDQIVAVLLPADYLLPCYLSALLNGVTYTLPSSPIMKIFWETTLSQASPSHVSGRQYSAVFISGIPTVLVISASSSRSWLKRDIPSFAVVSSCYISVCSRLSGRNPPLYTIKRSRLVITSHRVLLPPAVSSVDLYARCISGYRWVGPKCGSRSSRSWSTRGGPRSPGWHLLFPISNRPRYR